jgi:hypothetical protein
MKNKLLMTILLSLFSVATEASTSARADYRQKYKSVLCHYSQKPVDSLKYKAALFLIDNMEGHGSPEGIGIRNYIQRIHKMEKAEGIRQLQAAWYTSQKEGSTDIVPDSTIISSDFLINDIDDAFFSWNQSQWKDSITFRQFCQYILPYRINDEHLGENWRRPLRERYGSIIEHETNMKKAFALIRDTVFKVIALSNSYCEYNLDPMTCHMIGRAECGQRCILLVAVLRALCIPAVIDGTPMWSDYSNKGHAWVAMVANNGDTYTVFDKDKEAKRFNPIDASQFLPRYKVKTEDKYPYVIKTEKTPVKIYRICYDYCNKVGIYDAKVIASPFILDVSEKYGLTTDVTIKTDSTSTIYLCSYLSGQDWMPVAKAEAVNGYVTFRNIGKGSVCIPIIVYEGRKKALSCPFLVGTKGITKRYSPSLSKKRTININRKYPLCSYTTDTWAAIKGATFEGAMTKDFKHADTLAIITQTPFYMTTLNVSSTNKYRFLRYHAPRNNRSSLAELQFYTSDSIGNTQLLTGTYFAKGTDISKIENVFDGNPSTICKGINVGYTIGLDLGEGKEQSVSRITFCPSTDLNFVEKGHLYELYYFDNDWQLVDRKYAKTDSLNFNNVPEDALLLLKDRSGGTEERVFEYKDGKQIWH